MTDRTEEEQYENVMRMIRMRRIPPDTLSDDDVRVLADEHPDTVVRMAMYELLEKRLLETPTGHRFLTQSDLDALNPGSIVLDYYGDGWQKKSFGPYPKWLKMGSVDIELDLFRDLPERVVYRAPLRTVTVDSKDVS
jgi:hypothetical protein